MCPLELAGHVGCRQAGGAVSQGVRCEVSFQSPPNARCKAAVSSFVVRHNAPNLRSICSGVPESGHALSSEGTICRDVPNLSFSQPRATSAPPSAVRRFHRVSMSAWELEREQGRCGAETIQTRFGRVQTGPDEKRETPLRRTRRTGPSAWPGKSGGCDGRFCEPSAEGGGATKSRG